MPVGPSAGWALTCLSLANAALHVELRVRIRTLLLGWHFCHSPACSVGKEAGSWVGRTLKVHVEPIPLPIPCL